MVAVEWTWFAKNVRHAKAAWLEHAQARPLGITREFSSFNGSLGEPRLMQRSSKVWRFRHRLTAEIETGGLDTNRGNICERWVTNQ